MKALVVTLSLLATAPVLAANADSPNRSVDKSNDAGGPTGDDKVDQLNKGQLDENQRPAQGAAAQPRQDDGAAK